MIEVRDEHGMALSSPVGWVTMTLSRPGRASEVSVPRVNAVGTAGLSCAWTLPDLVARLSIFPFDADLDPDVWVRPVTSWAFLWELEALRACPITTLQMAFEDPAATRGAGPDGGQAFIALTVDTGTWEVIIGGPDEEQLAADAAAGLVPTHWQNDLETLAVNPIGDRLAMILPGDRVLRWNLPPMDTGQHCRFGANLCWSPTRSPAQTDDESPWFAALATTNTHLHHRATYTRQ
jgi:hypothetical protein